MKKDRNKSTLQDQRDFFSAFFGDDYCGCGDGESASQEEIESAIAECEMMLQESIDRADKSEISYWRKMLQENKVSRRELLST